MVLYLAQAILLALGAAVVVFALRQRREQVPGASRDEAVAALYRQRLSELRGELTAGRVAEVDRAQIEEELGAALLADIPSAPGTDNAPVRKSPIAVTLASMAVLLLGAVLVYVEIGDPLAMEIRGAEQVLQLDPASHGEALEEWRGRLERRVDARGEDAKSWYLLGHVDLKLGRFATAAEAFATARTLHGEDPGIDVLWLQARYLAANGQIDSTTREIAERVLASDPNHPTVLEIYALEAFRQSAYQDAVSLLNRALSGPLQANHRAALEAGFQEARTQLGDLEPALDVAIEAAAGMPAGMTLFVVARPVGGGMPFAVVRRPANGLPLTVRLDDAVSMNPALPLSSAGEIEIVVRLSQAGTAMAHPGDWEWRSQPVVLAELEAPLLLQASLQPPAS